MKEFKKKEEASAYLHHSLIFLCFFVQKDYATIYSMCIRICGWEGIFFINFLPLVSQLIKICGRLPISVSLERNVVWEVTGSPTPTGFF